MSENILCVKNIKKSFSGVHALKGVDLTIKKGETHCLAGENEMCIRDRCCSESS